MSRKIKLLSAVMISLVMAVCATQPLYAAPKTMPDGTLFDAEYYAQNNPDVVAVYGNSESALYAHYVAYGRAEGRKATADSNVVATPVASVKTVSEKSLAAANKTHNYYKGMPDSVVKFSDAYAKEIAGIIMSDPQFKTDLQRVQAASEVVQYMCSLCTYGKDSQGYYCSPAGVYVMGIYTCAGSTRALGRILDYMGYTWVHANEGKDKHQWCVLTMDGQTGFADGMGGFAGYGTMKNGMTLPDGRVISYAE
jgi:hypothetical protein